MDITFFFKIGYQFFIANYKMYLCLFLTIFLCSLYLIFFYIDNIIYSKCNKIKHSIRQAFLKISTKSIFKFLKLNQSTNQSYSVFLLYTNLRNIKMRLFDMLKKACLLEIIGCDKIRDVI